MNCASSKTEENTFANSVKIECVPKNSEDASTTRSGTATYPADPAA
jgi:hypothetical protein